MTINNVLKHQYFEWLCTIISPFNNIENISHYSQLLQTLYLIDYVPDNTMDHNRLLDGLIFRNRFAEANNIDEDVVNSYIDGPCSVLEMMVALAFRCENDIMYNPEKGDRTYLWFQTMLESLNLLDQANDRFDQYNVECRISAFLNKQYDANGRGGLFTVTSNNIDMRTKDIWYQMQAFLCEFDKYDHCKKIIISH